MKKETITLPASKIILKKGNKVLIKNNSGIFETPGFSKEMIPFLGKQLTVTSVFPLHFNVKENEFAWLLTHHVEKVITKNNIIVIENVNITPHAKINYKEEVIVFKGENFIGENFIYNTEKRNEIIRAMGFFAGMLSKTMLEASGCVVDYKINGENIEDIEKLHGLEIQEKLNLAIKEQRYEDAAKLRDILKSTNKEQ